ncbi:MAG: ABC transporter permease [Solirubrobacterales bacterium]|nr:ABC transporter permease [Solirubrobacterales bacterium]
MVSYIARRLLWVVVLLLVVSFITFVIFYLFPTGDPAALRAGRNPALIPQIRKTYGLDKPVYDQFWLYLKRLVLHFDLGTSYTNNSVSVRSEIFQRLPATISLALGAAVVWLTAGVLVGTVSAIKRRSIFDRLAMGGALLAISAPVFWLGLLALFLFASDVGKIPIFPGSGSYVPLTQNPWHWFTSLLMPWFVLAAAFAAIYARLLRASMIEVLSEDYIRTARAKGLSERRVIFHHALRAAMTPIVTAAGIDIGILLGGAILTETAFNIPGIGRLAFDSIQNADLPTVQGTVLVGALFILLANLVVDILYAVIDPRVRYS